jgi:hypothetical protein
MYSISAYASDWNLQWRRKGDLVGGLLGGDGARSHEFTPAGVATAYNQPENKHLNLIRLKGNVKEVSRSYCTV